MPTYQDTPSNPSSGFTTDQTLISFVQPVSNPSSGFTTNLTLISFVGTPAEPSSGFTGNVILTQFATIPNNPSNGWFNGPIITQIVPTGGTSSGGTLVTISGKGFTGATAVRFDSTNVTPLTVTDTTITVNTPPHVAGIVDVRIVFPSDITPICLFGKYIYASETLVSSISPSTGANDQSVVITGSGFTGATQVLFGSTPAASYIINSDTQITAISPSGTGQVYIQVVGLSNTSASTSASLFTYVPRPSLSTITPNTGPCVGGTPVTITGTNFTGATKVLFDNIEADSVVVVDDNTITCTSPRHDIISTATVKVVIPTNISSTTNVNYIYTNQAPVAIASATTSTSGNAPFTVFFSSSGSYDVDGGVLSYLWDFGDGQTSLSPSPSHTFNIVGTYVVKLKITDQSSVESLETDQSKVTVTVSSGNPNSLPIAVATANPTSGAGPLNVSFNGSQSSDLDGYIVSYSWNFGDGTATSSSANTSHVYNSVGTFTATLTITDNSGGISTSSVPITVTSIPPAVIPTITNVSPNQGPVTGYTDVTLTGTGFSRVSSVNFGSNLATIIQIRSDSEMVVRSPAGTGSVNITATTSQGTSTSTATFNYRTLGVVNTITPASGPTVGGTLVTIKGLDFTGATKVFFGNTEATSIVVIDNETITAVAPRRNTVGQVLVSVYSPIRGTSIDQVFFTYQNSLPIAIASSDKTSGDILLTVNFNGAASYDPDGDTITYLWDFGDGTTSTLRSPVHTFNSAGTYIVKLTVYDATLAASIETSQSKITITATENASNLPPTVIATSDIVSGTVPFFVKFNGGQSSDPDGSIISYYWEFGDGTTSTAINPIKKYTAAGTYYAKLTVFDNNGAKVSSPVIEIRATAINPQDYPTPIVTSIAPITGSSWGGDAVRVEGQNFTSATEVVFSPLNNDVNVGGKAEIIRLVDDNHMTVISPQGTGEVNVIVFNPGGHSARSLVSKFTYLSPPIAKITATPLSGLAPLTVNFSSDESYSDFGSIVSYFWNFNDGTLLDFSDNDTSNDPNPTHTFNAAGTYLVELSVKDERGIVGKTSVTIFVDEQVGGFPVDQYPGGIPLPLPGGNGGGGTYYYPPDTIPPPTNPPVYLNSSCALSYSHVNNGIYNYGALPAQGYIPSFSEDWKIVRDLSGVRFRLTVTILRDLKVDGLFIGAISITSDGNFPRPAPSQSSAVDGFGGGKIIRIDGFSVEDRFINNIYKPKVVGGIIPKGSTVTLEAKAPLVLDIAYAQFGFINAFGTGTEDTTVAFVNIDCILERNRIPNLRNQMRDDGVRNRYGPMSGGVPTSIQDSSRSNWGGNTYL